MTEGFPRLRRESAAAEAARLVQDKILSGELRAGQRLPSERELSEALGVSRPTVREALRSLVAMNILDSRHGSGTFVSDLEPTTLAAPLRFAMALSPVTVTELFEARLVVEPELAALAATRATADQRDHLEECVRLARESRGDPAALVELDLRLHHLIAQAAHSSLLSQMLETIGALARASRTATARVPGVAQQTIEEHEAIAAAIVAADPSGARQAMADHLRRIAGTALAEAEKSSTPPVTGRRNRRRST